jgi:serralysin
MGSAVAVSYSFVESAPSSGVGASGFRAFTGAERQVVRDILAAASATTNITFQEANENSGPAGQLRFGVSQQVDTKGVSLLPSTAAGDIAAGDVWMDVESMVNLAAGSEGFAALMHEIGHALGLRHPRNVDAGDAWIAQVRDEDDVTSLTVMSGTQSGDGLFRADWGALDIGALRYLYGTKTMNTGNSTYDVGGLDAQAQRTILDDAGIDVISATASAVGVFLDLNPGARSSVGVTAQGLVAVDNLTLGLGTWIEIALGSDQDDVFVGNNFANTFDGGLGNDVVDGAGGTDIARFDGNRAAYTLSEAFGYRYVAANDGVSGFDTLSNVERLQFADHSLAFDTTGNPGQAVKLLGAVTGPALAANPYYIGIVLNYLDGGMPATTLASFGLDAMLGPDASSAAVVNLLYFNLVGFYPNAGDLASLTALIDGGTFTKAQLAVVAAETSYNIANIGLAGMAATGVTYDAY